MKPPSKEVDVWVDFARRYRLDSWTAFALETFDPLAPVAAQMLYLIEPVLGPRSGARVLARVLEDGRAREDLRRRLEAERRA
jgi:hypothetical protein